VANAELSITLLLTVASLACVSDLRTGRIPNWLTCPTLILGPSIAAAYGGMPGLALSLVGILLAGGSALLVYGLGGLGGGDVKLFAALAGLSGPRVGLEIELFALSCAIAWAWVALLHRKQLRAWARALCRLEAQERSAVRLGGAILAGTVIALGRQLF
jgi:prepilin peptidase CpaA